MPAARFHQAETNGHPDTSNNLKDAKNQNHNSKSQFVIVWVLGVTSGFWNWVHPSITITKIVCIFNCCTVETDDYSTKHSRCDGEPHEYTSLQNKIIKYSCHKGRCFTGTISVYEHLCLTSFGMRQMTTHFVELSPQSKLKQAEISSSMPGCYKRKISRF